jgi:hypothetical protein
MKQSEKIIFRVKPQLKEFVKEFAGKMGMDTSDFMRLMIEYYFMAMFSQTGSYKEIRERFFTMYPDRKNNTKPRVKK